MIFNNFFCKKNPDNWENNKRYLKSTTDLRLLPTQVIYVEGKYNNKINRIINTKYDEIASKFEQSDLFADFIYLPVKLKELQRSDILLIDILNYYFPNNRSIRGKIPWSILTAPQTESISKLLFSAFAYKDQIEPGLFRYIGKNEEDFFIYEYFPFESSNKRQILNQIDYYTDTISLEEKPLPENFFNAEIHEPEEEYLPVFKPSFPKSSPEITVESRCYGAFRESRKPEQKHPDEFLLSRNIESVSKSLFDDDDKLIADELETTESPILLAEPEDFVEETFLLAEPEDFVEETISKEYELISRIKSDIQNLKDLGFYELLLKEIGLGNTDYRKNQPHIIFQPSRLTMDENFKIYLPDFKGMEIEMTPLPKSLFILFLRHPEGINLKSLIDYKIELLEIYKLLSYHETYFKVVESIDRICNPLEGSINEKLSRIKEAFLKKISMDTAKNYIVVGERGMKKKIELDRSLVELPKALEEIELTNIAD